MNIGSAWKKESKDGKKFISCVIQSPFIPGGEMNFAIFKVEEKKSEKAPDYSIVWSKPQPKQAPAQETPPAADGDDIPF